MLKVRLSRTGKKSQPSYRIIVKEAKSKRDGRYIDLLGFYNPLTNPATVKLNKKKYLSWLKKGAQPTATVRHLAKKA